MNKKFFNLLMIVGALFLFTISSCKKDDAATPAPADSFMASTTESNKVAVLEDFTGVRCGYCPQGHDIAKGILDANPGKFIVIAVHTGSYAAPQAGWPNFTTSFGTAIDGQAKVSGYPAGTISRTLCSSLGVAPQIAGGYAMSRSSWATAASVIMAQVAPVNIGAKATYSSANKTLTVKVDLYFTSDVTGAVNLNVALLQDKLYGKQSGGTPADAYEQNHVLRHLLTGQWGAEISTSGQTKGTKVSKTYTYVVPDDYNGATIPPGGGAVVIDDLSVVAFVANGHTSILNAKQVDVK